MECAKWPPEVDAFHGIFACSNQALRHSPLCRPWLVLQLEGRHTLTFETKWGLNSATLKVSSFCLGCTSSMSSRLRHHGSHRQEAPLMATSGGSDRCSTVDLRHRARLALQCEQMLRLLTSILIDAPALPWRSAWHQSSFNLVTTHCTGQAQARIVQPAAELLGALGLISG